MVRIKICCLVDHKPDFLALRKDLVECDLRDDRNWYFLTEDDCLFLSLKHAIFNDILIVQYGFEE